MPDDRKFLNPGQMNGARRWTLNGRRMFYSALVGSAALSALAAPTLAEQVSREQDIAELRLGQRVLVDDGSCPAGQIKEVLGSQMTASGIVRSRKCIPRLGTKKR